MGLFRSTPEERAAKERAKAEADKYRAEQACGSDCAATETPALTEIVVH